LLSRYEQKIQEQAELYRETDRLARFVYLAQVRHRKG
jgi:hypothetical protein